jgi:maltose O-acetyltransferase
MLILKLLKPISSLISYYNYKYDRLRLAERVKRGLKVGKNVYISEHVEFDIVYPFLIEIGDNCRISKDVRILAHDATTFRELGVTRVAPVKILDGTFIGERVIILPGVTLGPNAMIAAGSVVNRDITEDKLAAGNPARPYGNYSELLQKYFEIARSSNIFNNSDIESGAVSADMIRKAIEKNSLAFTHGVPISDPYYVNTDMDALRKNAVQAYEKLLRSGSSQVSD